MRFKLQQQKTLFNVAMQDQTTTSPIEETIQRIEAVTAMDVQEVAEILFSHPLSLSAIGPGGQLQGLDAILE